MHDVHIIEVATVADHQSEQSRKRLAEQMKGLIGVWSDCLGLWDIYPVGVFYLWIGAGGMPITVVYGHVQLLAVMICQLTDRDVDTMIVVMSVGA